ncbi:MAG: hypothetical protein KIT84_03180 [Labilithrix sp.]|nr:hypothetical protein [Labilithrix sp.]MCW5809985.1 hypothetical protein [Labilithrix sp.]
MPTPNAARPLDPVAEAVANALEDEREATPEEIEALREARADGRLIPGHEITARLAERSRTGR